MDAGDSAPSQAIFDTSAFFRSDGVSPAPVTFRVTSVPRPAVSPLNLVRRHSVPLAITFRTSSAAIPPSGCPASPDHKNYSWGSCTHAMGILPRSPHFRQLKPWHVKRLNGANGGKPVGKGAHFSILSTNFFNSCPISSLLLHNP
jgi:hypothetical protein